MDTPIDAFMPHGMCYQWRPGILALHVGSDLLTALAYFSIPTALIAFLRRRPDVEFSFLFWLFVAFILSCGVTHLLSIVVVWEPIYRFEGAAKAVAAVASVVTAIALWPLVPRLVALPRPAQLEQRNREIEALNASLEARLDSLTRLSGGVAHDFNNLLMVIEGHAEELRTTHEAATSEQTEDLDAIRDATRRATGLCRRMLAYSGRGHFLLREEAVPPLVERALSRARSAPHTVDVRSGLPTVPASAEQIEELLNELLDNAREAVEARGAGTVTLSAREETFDAETLAGAVAEHRVRPGPAVVLEVRDEGEGVDEAIRSRMFEPYFSTRFTGRGLGLAAVHGIARGHGAALFVDGERGRGTRVRFVFPQQPEEQAHP